MRLFLTIILWIAGPFILTAQETDLCRKSTEGKDFWFGFMESRNYNPNHYLEITVTAREATTFTITIGTSETPFGGTYTVNANNSRQVLIPWDLVEAIGSEEIQDKGIHLVAQKPVNLYALNWDQNSADVAVIYPVESLGNEHFAMCYYPDIDLNSAVSNGKNSEFLIVATVDSTEVVITPSKITDRLNPKDSAFTVILNKGEIYQVQSENIEGTGVLGQGDLTGSHVMASKPIAFYSGSLSTTVPSGECCWDHLYEQIPPVQAWGREYFAVPLQSRQQDRYRILAAEDNTTIQITGRLPFVLNRGEYEELVFFYNDPKRIFADKPILVAQFSQSRNVDRQYTGGNGDPFMIILSSTAQSKNDVTFVAYESLDLDIQGYTGIEKYFVNIVTLTSEVPNILLNGQSIVPDFKPFVENKYSYAQKVIVPGTHRIENTKKEGGFLAYVYGFGGVESYGYGVGFNLDLILDLGESINFHGDTLLLCAGDSVVLDAGPYFDSYNWNTGATSQTQTITEKGWYSVQTSTRDGCQLEDSIYIFVSHPKTDLGIDSDEGCFPYSIELTGDNGYEKYLWQNEFGDTLSTNQKFIASKTGEFKVTVFDNYNCAASDKMNLVVFPVPEVNLSGSKLICGEKNTEIEVSISGTPENIWNFNGSYNWSSNLSSVVFSESTIRSTKIDVPEWGDYEIYFQLQTVDNCITIDTFPLRFHPQPSSLFNFEDDAKCEGYSKKLIFPGFGAATDSATFYWDLDGCQFVDTLGWQTYNVSVGAFLNKQPFIQLVINDNGCISDTTIKPLGAKPNFVMEADNRRGCDELTVNFSSYLLTDDKVDFYWTFDDSKTVNQQNVIIHYTETGFYKVNLTIVNPITQCTNGFTLDSMIRVFPTPTAKISVDPTFCYTDSAHIFYTHNIDSSLCFWKFSGLHQVGPGNDSITVIIDNPTGNVQLIVDEFGCKSSPVEMQLKRKPHFNFFAENEEGCEPYSVDIFAEPHDSLLNFFWVTDSLPYPQDFSHQYYFANQGKYNVTLTAYSNETGCSDTLIKTDWIRVHPKPLSKFEVDFPVALIENATITYTNYSERAVDYLWDFGDGETTDLFEPVHTFKELGEYNNLLYAVSDFGCPDTSEFLIKILPFSVYAPNAFRPNSEIPENRTFLPVGIGADENRFNLKVFDRWGQIVFETNSPYNPWDGTTKKGDAAPMGNYVWISHFYDIQGYEHNQKGQILLIR